MVNAATLFDKAAANYRSAAAILQLADGDEEQVNMAGYHLQQAVELALKYLLEMDGIEFPRVHDIDQLIRCGRENSVELCLTPYIEDHAEMFSQWEAKPRYILGYAIEAAKVERALREVDDYLAKVAQALS